MGKGKAFLEILTSALNEDYRFPILEVFAFLYALSTFAFASFGPMMLIEVQPETIAYGMVKILLGLPLFIFIILIFKNVAYGFGSDLEKGVIQTYLSYPIKRHAILTAKLISAIGVALLMFLGTQIFALYILAPDITIPHINTILITYLANLSFPLFTTGLILLITLFLRKAGSAVVLGLVLYFALGISTGIITFLAYTTELPIALKAISVLSPDIALARYYQTQFPGSPFTKEIWTPTFNEVLTYIGVSYIIMILPFSIAYLHFSRRFGA